MRLPTAIFSLVGLCLGLAGCGGSTCTPDASSSTQAIVASTESAQGSGYYDGHYHLRCPDGTTSVEVALGTHTENTTSFSVTQSLENDEYGNKQQASVTIRATAPSGSMVPTAIVHTRYSDDKELRLRIGTGGVVDMTIQTIDFVDDASLVGVMPITSITFCTKATAGTPAPTATGSPAH